MGRTAPARGGRVPGIISSLDNDRPLQSGGGAGTAHPCPLVLLGESQTKYLSPPNQAEAELALWGWHHRPTDDS